MTVPLTSDWHIYSRNSCDGAAMAIAHLIGDAQRAGVCDFGVTDHLHTPYNLPDIAASRAEYDACSPSERFHFGIEVSCVSEWELGEVASGRHEDPVYGVRSGGPPGATPAIGLTLEDMDRYNIEYVVAGTHWPLYVPFERDAIIRDYHRQNMFLATHELVDVVAHPWWWMGHWQGDDDMYRAEPWFDDFGVIPRSMHEEFAAAARDHGTVVEINVGAMLTNPQYPASFAPQYLDYIASLREASVTLSIASDCHSERYDPPFETAERMLSGIGITDADLWKLPPRETA